MKNRLIGALAAIGCVTLAACSVADPDTSQIVLHYSGGAFSSQQFEYCTNPGIREVGGAGDYDFYYPAGQRTFTFSDRPGADAPPIRVSTRNQTELIVRGSITYTVNPDCRAYKDASGRNWPGGKLQRLHDTIGRQHKAYATEGGDPAPEGWRNVTALYIGGPSERAMDNAGLGFPWQDLYSNPDAKNAWTRAVEDRLPQLIKEQAGDDLFIINNIQLDKPDVPDALRLELESNQAAALRKQTADTDLSAATGFPGGLTGYQQYKQQEAVTKAIAEGRVNPLIVPNGAPVIVSPR